MMQVLLEDRFRLKVHSQTGEGPVYFLTVARGGPKLRAITEGSCTHRAVPLPPPQPGQEYSKELFALGSPAVVDVQGATLDYFSKLLPLVLDRPVINKTGINGRFDIHVEFGREGTKLAAMAPLQSVDGATIEMKTTAEMGGLAVNARLNPWRHRQRISSG